MRYELNAPPMNPVTRLLAALVAILVLVGAFFFGIFILAVVLGVGVISACALGLRGWWLRRTGAIPRPPDVIEAEYQVMSRRSDED